MVNPLKSLTINTHPLGNELHLEWELPDSFPDSYWIVIFKNTSAITEQQISDYFDGVESGVTVEKITPDVNGNIVNGIVDMNVENKKTYYYRIVVQDRDNEEYSTTVDGDKEVACSYDFSLIDCKDIIIKAIKRIMLNYEMIDWKHYEIRRAWTPPTEKNPTIYVIRAPNIVVHRYLGNMIQNMGGKTIHGEIEQDNIEIVWEDPNFKRIDTLTNIFRTNKTVIRRYLSAEGVMDIEIIMGGDAINTMFRDRMTPIASMMVQCLIETTLEYSDKTIHEIKKQVIQPVV